MAEYKKSITWRCLECDGQPEFEAKDIRDHMETIHAIDTKNTKGEKKLSLALDGSKWYQNSFDFTINGKKFVKIEYGERL